MKLQNVLKGIQILREDVVDPELEISGIQYNSKKIEKGDLFVAIKGYTVDGHRFIEDAVSRGAAAVLVTDWQEGLGVPQIRTADNRTALAKLANNYYDHPSACLNVLAITASNGKTTTAKLLAEILRATGQDTGLIGTVNYEYGDVSIPSKLTTPESLELQGLLRDMVSAGTKNLVMEVSSQAIEMSRTHGIRFQAVALNNITREHIDQHGTFEAYWAQKKRLITEADTSTEIVLNADDEYAASLQSVRPDAYTFGHEKPADLRCENLDLSTGFARFDVVVSDRCQERCAGLPARFPIEIGVAGYHMVLNALSAIALALLHGVDFSTIQEAVKGYKGVERRFEMLYEGDFKVLDDHFANVGNINVTLQTLAYMEYKRLVLAYAIRGNRGVTVNRENLETLIPRLEELRCDHIIATLSRDVAEAHDTVSPEEEEVFRAEMDRAGVSYVLYDTLEEATKVALDTAREGDVVLLAGCQGMDAGGRLFLEQLSEKDPENKEKILAPIVDRIAGV